MEFCATIDKRRKRRQGVQIKQMLKFNNCRKSLKEYTSALLNQFITINAVLAIAFYFTYMLDIKTIQRTGVEFLYITVIPFSIIIFRLLFKIFTCSNNDDPADLIYNDKTLKILMLIYLIILFVILSIK